MRRVLLHWDLVVWSPTVCLGKRCMYFSGPQERATRKKKHGGTIVWASWRGKKTSAEKGWRPSLPWHLNGPTDACIFLGHKREPPGRRSMGGPLYVPPRRASWRSKKTLAEKWWRPSLPWHLNGPTEQKTSGKIKWISGERGSAWNLLRPLETSQEDEPSFNHYCGWSAELPK